MIVDTARSLAQLLAEACQSVARTVAPDEVLDDVDLGPVHDGLAAPSQTAVTAALGGAVSGEVAVFVDDALVEELAASSIAGLDLAAALLPTFDALGAALGAAVVGTPEAIDGRLAISRLSHHAASGMTAMFAGSVLRAAVGIALSSAPSQAPVAVPTGMPSGMPPAAPASFERLDLLRGVEMAATVELGRTQMTINDLLSLHEGAIIELDRAAGDAADLFVNGRLIARGEIVVVDENYALRVTQIVSGEGL